MSHIMRPALLPDTPKSRRYWIRPPGAALALALVEAARQHDAPVIVTTADTHAAHALESEIAAIAGESLPVLQFPDWETLPYDLFAPHPEIISQRIAAMYRLPSLGRSILVVPMATLMQRLPPRTYIHGSGLVLECGQQLDLDDERDRLDASGYRNVPTVNEPGDFAVRGAILDIFATGATTPYRIELFDDRIESIRSFDPQTQRSIEQVDEVRLLPAREFPLTEDSARQFRHVLRERFPIDPRRCPLYQDMRQGRSPAGIEYYLPLFFQHDGQPGTQTLFDYLPEHSVLVLGVDALRAADTFWDQAQQRHEQRAHDIERPILPVAELYLSPQQVRERLNESLCVEITTDPAQRHALDLGSAPAPMVPIAQQGDTPAAALKAFVGSHQGHILIAAVSAGRREALIDQLREHDLHPETVASWPAFAAALADGSAAPLSIAVSPLEVGFSLPDAGLTVLTEHELLGQRAPAGRRRTRPVRDPDTIIRDLTELALGAPIVHDDHGVGRYQGLVNLSVGETADEFLAIEYADGDKLYVPVAQLHLVGRYTGASEENAPLHSLRGEAWQRAKRKAAEQVRDVAAELLAIHAQREARSGTAMAIDRAHLAQFAAGFPFEETPDQLGAINAVLDDLAAARPMDRVVCGDVGFGKTEVALRAAFAAASSGKQVGVLVPTTLLAQQHGETFRDRFADFPMRVEVLSRFQGRGESAAMLTQLANGEIDIIIGTHRLLQPDVRFHDLGLLVVDEEQRFGVRQKEQLKALRAEVDILTLTATPIPRTLSMSLSGLRDLSIIATPPTQRTAVKTFIGSHDDALLREALQRELARGGQVYYLHNEVKTIERAARQISELLPDVRLRIAHGQMPERELEQVMLDFYRQRFNVLVCTTIIESGIDVPSANTIIINRADRFGLAQLHQLRGRVGRSHQRAYAYLIVPSQRSMTADARKRLDALASLDELGAGFTLATHDLEIRGAGELLGDEQSGQIQQVGYSLYSELLERAVSALRSGKVPDYDLISEHETIVELHLPALIPDDYLPDINTRLTLYKRIASARDDARLRELQVEMIDRFGLLPDPVKNLFATTALKLQATAMGVRKLDIGERGGRVFFKPEPNIDPAQVIRLIQTQPNTYSLDGQDTLRLRAELDDPALRLKTVRELLTTLALR